jgi:FkbM family methyltransferase
VTERAPADLADGELLALAQTLAWTRPLAPVPGWRFGSDWDNPAFRRRREVWEACKARRLREPVLLDWHLGLRCFVHLGNDLSLPLFVGGCIDPNELSFLSRVLQPGATFVDAGANEGLYALFASRLVGDRGRVVAVEPSSREFARLQRNVEQNALRNVRAHRVALGAQPGTASLTIAEEAHAGQNTLGAFAYAGVRAAGAETVTVQRLDDLLAAEGRPRVAAIKIDVEGSELAVLRGARETLRRDQPLLLLELSEPALASQGSSGAALGEFLSSLAYVTYSFSEATGLPVERALQGASDNVVAAPAGRTLP